MELAAHESDGAGQDLIKALPTVTRIVVEFEAEREVPRHAEHREIVGGRARQHEHGEECLHGDRAKTSGQILLFLLSLGKRELMQERFPEGAAAVAAGEVVEMRWEEQVRQPRQRDEKVVDAIL